nr:sodium/proton-translocating pyrophosphatase [Alphaproteobacteria bacterium]
MSSGLAFAIVCGLIALVYGIWAVRSVLSESGGNERMQEIAAAIQVGARAYLNRQYLTIGAVGAVIFVILFLLFNISVALAFLVGAVLSGAAGYIGMNVSVRANVRTAEGARKSLGKGLEIAFKSGAITGMLVAGLALLAVSVTYAVLLKMGVQGRDLIDPLV